METINHNGIIIKVNPKSDSVKDIHYNGKKIKSVKANGKRYHWNYVYHVYNAQEDYSQLNKHDIKDMEIIK